MAFTVKRVIKRRRRARFEAASGGYVNGRRRTGTVLVCGVGRLGASRVVLGFDWVVTPDGMQGQPVYVTRDGYIAVAERNGTGVLIHEWQPSQLAVAS